MSEYFTAWQHDDDNCTADNFIGVFDDLSLAKEACLKLHLGVLIVNDKTRRYLLKWEYDKPDDLHYATSIEGIFYTIEPIVMNENQRL